MKLLQEQEFNILLTEPHGTQHGNSQLLRLGVLEQKLESLRLHMRKTGPTTPLALGRTLTHAKGRKAPTGRACGRCRGRAGQGLATNTSKTVAR